MNLRNVLRAYSLLRVLSDDEAALLETLRAANDNERQLIAEAMSDKPEVKTRPQSEKCGICNMTRKTPVHSDKRYTDYHEFEKKAGKKSASKSRQSKRELSLRQQIGGVVQGSGNNLQPRCTAQIDDNGGLMECGETVDANVHHKRTDPGYHEFQSAVAAAVSGD